MSQTGNRTDGTSEWEPLLGRGEFAELHQEMYYGEGTPRTWFYKEAPAIKAMHLIIKDKVVISVDPHPHPEQGDPPSIPVDTIEDVAEDEVEDALEEVDILPLLADRYTDLAYSTAEEMETLEGDAA